MHRSMTPTRCRASILPQKSLRTLIGTISISTFAREAIRTFCWPRYGRLKNSILPKIHFFLIILWQALKYWRYRMFLLPKDDPVMRKIIDNNLQRCDIYTTEISVQAQKIQIEELTRLIETHLNKIKKSNVKKPRVSVAIRIYQFY